MYQQDQPQLLRLQRVEVDGLFGIYDHRIDLNLHDRVTLLHGQNGVGKTTVLRMINALLRNDIAYFSRIPFTRFLLTFKDNSSLELIPTDPNTENDMSSLTLTREGREKKSDNIALRSGAEFLAARTGYLEPHGGIENTWIDVRDGEVLTEEEVLSRYGRRGRKYPRGRNFSWLDDFLQNADTHLIEAQRLVRTHFDPTSDPTLWSDLDPGPYRHPTLTSSVVECSRDFRKRLDRTMAAYGRQAQTLDQSFPQRLISITDELAIHEIQARMETLTKKTGDYKKIGILDETTTHPFDVDRLGDLDDTQVRVMTLYLQDTERKLGVLDDLADRTHLLLKNVNDKFRHKTVLLDREEGLVAQGDEDKRLSLHSLSSGEQHELVLHYDLLFKTLPNTVVLIDEPEISLHVAWQKNFLPDLMEIVRISGFDAIVATHSPYIVGDRDDLMVDLGDSIQVA